jgi:hypothetical protein
MAIIRTIRFHHFECTQSKIIMLSRALAVEEHSGVAGIIFEYLEGQHNHPSEVCPASTCTNKQAFMIYEYAVGQSLSSMFAFSQRSELLS